MKQVELGIPGMQSTHCQTRVKNAVSEINGVQIDRLENGKLTFSVASNTVQKEVIQAIEHAGYAVSREDDNNCSIASSACCRN